jgi:hypothetical protein
MKEERKKKIPTTEFITPAGPYRFYYNHSVVTREGEKMHTADFIEVDELTRDKVVAALVRTKYTIDSEFAVMRKKASKENEVEFTDYNNHVKWCKQISI